MKSVTPSRSEDKPKVILSVLITELGDVRVRKLAATINTTSMNTMNSVTP